MNNKIRKLYLLSLLLIPVVTAFVTQVSQNTSTSGDSKSKAMNLFDQGKDIFRYDTFGDEAYWGGQLLLLIWEWILQLLRKY